MASLMDSIAASLSPYGLLIRGGLVFDDDMPAPPILTAEPFMAKSVLLVGHAGAAHWPHFLKWRSTRPSALRDPLDSWSREVIGAVAEKFGGRAASPSDRPFLPFQQWAMRAEGLRPSPLGVLMHPEYGLWHAYRGALLFDAELDLPQPRAANHLCDACIGKPCRKACPVGAHSEAGFAYEACLDHVRGPLGELCRSGGCFDRNACPYGSQYRYPPDIQAFHMAAFARVS